MTSELEHLARHVLARREQLGLSQIEVWEAGGPSNSTLTKIEAAKPPAPARATLRKLDKGLRWHDGSAVAVLAGGEPDPLPEDEVLGGNAGGAAEWIVGNSNEVDLATLNLDELAEHWAFLDFEASKAGREYARRRGLTLPQARDELYRYLREGGLPSEDHPDDDRSEHGDGSRDPAPTNHAGVSPATDASRRLTSESAELTDEPPATARAAADSAPTAGPTVGVPTLRSRTRPSTGTRRTTSR